MLPRVRSWLRSDMRVLRWVFLAAYLALIAGLLLLGLSNGEDGLALLLLVAVFVGGQLLFILGAGTIHLCRPIRKRRLWMPVVVGSFQLTLLVAGLLIALAELLYIERHLDEDVAVFGFWFLLLVSWIVWGALFWVRARRWQRYQVLTRLTTTLFAGSLLELVAAVPSHVVVSRRPGCLVGLGTMLGIIAGINVMLFSFGPGLAVLFLRPRYRRERMEAPTACLECDYDLTGTLAAGGKQCPECGAEVVSLPG